MQQIVDACNRHKVPCATPLVADTRKQMQALQKKRIAQGFRIMYLTGSLATYR